MIKLGSDIQIFNNHEKNIFSSEMAYIQSRISGDTSSNFRERLL